MTSADERSASGVFLAGAQYAYDVYDHRILSVTTDISGIATETHFAYDGDHLFALLDAGNHLVKRYVSLDALDSAFVRIGAAGGVQWLLGDRLGSIRDIVNNNGDVIDHREFDAWGNLTSETNPSQGEQIGYAGYWYEVTVGLCQVWHRWYDATTGRWMSKDPMSFAAGDSNLYRTVGNDVTNATDPTGVYELPSPSYKPFVYSPAKNDTFLRAPKKGETYTFPYGVTSEELNIRRFKPGTKTLFLGFIPYGDGDETPEHASMRRGCVGLNAIRLNIPNATDRRDSLEARAFNSIEAAKAAQQQMIGQAKKSQIVVVYAISANAAQKYLDKKYRKISGL